MHEAHSTVKESLINETFKPQIISSDNEVTNLASNIIPRLSKDCTKFSQTNAEFSQSYCSSIKSQCRSGSGVVSSEDNLSSSEDGDRGYISSDLDTSVHNEKKSVNCMKRVTWSGLDDLDYVPTRTMSKRSLRRKRKKNVKQRISSHSQVCNIDSNLSTGKMEVKKPVSSAKRLTAGNAQKLTKIKMRTGVLYIYKGANPRVVFKRC